MTGSPPDSCLQVLCALGTSLPEFRVALTLGRWKSCCLYPTRLSRHPLNWQLVKYLWSEVQGKTHGVVHFFSCARQLLPWFSPSEVNSESTCSAPREAALGSPGARRSISFKCSSGESCVPTLVSSVSDAPHSPAGCNCGTRASIDVAMATPPLLPREPRLAPVHN